MKFCITVPNMIQFVSTVPRMNLIQAINIIHNVAIVKKNPQLQRNNSPIGVHICSSKFCTLLQLHNTLSFCTSSSSSLSIFILHVHVSILVCIWTMYFIQCTAVCIHFLYLKFCAPLFYILSISISLSLSKYFYFFDVILCHSMCIMNCYVCLNSCVCVHYISCCLHFEVCWACICGMV